MRRLSLIAVVCLVASIRLFAQGAVKTLPDNYKATFENEYVLRGTADATSEVLRFDLKTAVAVTR